MTCYLEFRVFRRQTIVAWPIESTDLVIFLALNDFLNVAKSHLNTFLFKVLVVFFCCMDGIYIILIIKARRIRIESCRLNDTFEEQRLSFSSEILGKVFPIDPQVNLIWRCSRLYLLLQQYHIRKGWELLTRRYLSFIIYDKESFLSVIFWPVFSRRSGSFDSSHKMTHAYQPM